MEIKYPHELIGDEVVRYKPVGERMDLDGAHVRRSTIVGASLVSVVAFSIDPANITKVFQKGAD